MLYTPIPPEDIWGSQVNGESAERRWHPVDGRLILVASGPDGRPRIERLLSTDPRDYLDPRYQPGAEAPPLT